WLQTGAELGFPGLLALLMFFTAPMVLLLPIARGRSGATQAEGDLARMVVCGLAGYLVASQFITVYGVEAPYFVAMMGGGLVHVRSLNAAHKIQSLRADRAALLAGATHIAGHAPRPMGAVAQ